MTEKKKVSLSVADKSDFEGFYSELERSFISEEYRDKDEALELLERGEYVLYRIEVDGETVGFTTVWELSGFAYVEHLVSGEAHRNKGYGGQTLAILRERYGNLVLEAELPADGITARRIGFYERNGFCRNPQYYFQPPFRREGKGVELVLMSYPRLLSSFDQTAAELYRRVYGRKYGE